MKVFFWIMFVVLGILELNAFRGFFNVLLRENSPLDKSGLRTFVIYIILGLLVAGGGIYLLHIGRVKWACVVVSLPLAALVLYLFVFVILPYLMGGSMR